MTSLKGPATDGASWQGPIAVVGLRNDLRELEISSFLPNSLRNFVGDPTRCGPASGPFRLSLILGALRTDPLQPRLPGLDARTSPRKAYSTPLRPTTQGQIGITRLYDRNPFECLPGTQTPDHQLSIWILRAYCFLDTPTFGSVMTMNFGFGAADFIAVLEKVNRLRDSFADAPAQFRAISREYACQVSLYCLS